MVVKTFLAKNTSKIKHVDQPNVRRNEHTECMRLVRL